MAPAPGYAYGPGPEPYYEPSGHPPVAYACHYQRFRAYNAYGNPIVVRRRVCN
jgi:hypothetical protein